MKKNWGLLGVLLVLSLAVSLLLWLALRHQASNQPRTVYDAVPAHTILVASLTSLGKTWKNIQTLPYAKALRKLLPSEAWDFLSHLDTLQQTNEVIKSLFSNSRVAVWFSFLGKRDIAATFAVETHFLFTPSTLEEWIREKLSMEVRYLPYAGRNIGSLHAKEPTARMKTCFFVLYGDLLLFSQNQMMLENSIRHLDASSGKTTNTNFEKATEAASAGADLSVFIHHKSFSKLLSYGLRPFHFTRVKDWGLLADWTAYDVQFSKEKIFWGGLSFVEDKHFFSSLLKQSPVKGRISGAIPASATYYMAQAIPNRTLYLQRLKKFMQEWGRFAEQEIAENKLKSKTFLRAIEDFLSLIGSEAAIVNTNFIANQPDANKLAVILLKSPSQAKQFIEKLLKRLLPKGKKWHQYISKYRIDNELSYTIYRLTDERLFNTLLGDYFLKDIEAKYCVIANDMFILGRSQTELGRYLTSLARGRMLRNSNEHNELISQVTTNGYNLKVYFSMQRGFHQLHHWANLHFKPYLKNIQEALELFPAACWQVVDQGEDKTIYSDGAVLFQQGTGKNAHRTVWQSQLDAMVRTKPIFVLNHKSRQDNEIFVQDAQNNCYLINRSGRTLWKIPIDEPILGKPVQIDYYRNNKLQYLFNTPTKVYLIDRNGNRVANYPIRLPSPATAPLRLLDFDNNRNYRYFIPCSNRKIYDFDKQGRMVTGWTFKRTDTKLRRPIAYFLYQGRDFLVAIDRNRLWILNRRGEERFTQKEWFSLSENASVWFQGKGKNHPAAFVTTSTDGTVYKIDMKGKVSKHKLATFSPQHYFIYEDLNGDARKDYFFLDGKRVVAYDHDHKLLFKRTMERGTFNEPMVYSFSLNLKKIGLVDTENGNIYLLDGRNKMHPGFPLTGYSHFSIGFLSSGASRFSLLVAGEDNTLYNYYIK